MSLQAAFERAYYPPEGTPWPPLRWRGVPCQKLATDLWALGELVQDLTPGLVLETGTAAGGTALFLADLLAPHGGVVWTVDQAAGVAAVVRRHPAISVHTGNSLAGPVVRLAQVAAAAMAAQDRAVLVLLDSNHEAAHVTAELAAYAPLVTIGSYCIVEDTNLGDTVMPAHGPGPAGPVAAWLAAAGDAWMVDTARQPAMTTNPGGYLRRLA